MYSKLHHCWATVKVYFSLNELTHQSKKTDKQGSPEMKNFHSVTFDYSVISHLGNVLFFFRNLKSFYCFEFLAYFSFQDIL